MPALNSICLMDNQFLNESLMTVSSIDSSYPVANMLDPVRSRVFKPLVNTFTIKVDFKYNAPINFIGMTGPLSRIFGMSEVATVLIEANNIDNFTSPPLSKTVNPEETGLYVFLDEDSAFRYWEITITDPNPMDIVDIGYFYMGDYVQIAERTFDKGFGSTGIDPTSVEESIDGTEYFDEKIPRNVFNGINLGYMHGDDRENINDVYRRLGKHTPMFVSLDPNLCISDSGLYGEMTKFMRMEGPPRDIHTFDSRYSMSFIFREVV